MHYWRCIKHREEFSFLPLDDGRQLCCLGNLKVVFRVGQHDVIAV
jgi:hypothetical protein